MSADFIGKTIGGYRIIEQIGLGGMATVYKAYQPSVDRYVALKVLSTHLTQDPAFVRRFQQEAKVIAKLEHLHILPVYDHGEQDGYLYLVMRFIEAGTLQDRLARGHLSLEEARRVVSQVGSALDYAHQRGVVHRDLKPSNVLIDPQGDCYLTDFGIAKMVEGTLGLTGSGVIGTPHYMAPEQGQSLKVDQRADVYAMGVVIYEMVTGQVPFDAETPIAVVLKHITEPLPLPRSVRPDLPEAVERVILKALAKDPADRYQGMRDLVTAFDQAVGVTSLGLPPMVEEVKAPLMAAPIPVRRQTAPKRLWLLAAAGLALLVPALVILVLAGMILSRAKIGGGQVQVRLGGVVTPAPVSTSTQSAGNTGRETPTMGPIQMPTVTAVVTQEASQPPVVPSPTPTFTHSASEPTATVPTASTLPAGSWQAIPDLPRQINALAVDPTNPQVLYAGTGNSGAGSGVYKSEDAGLTWRSVSAGLPHEDVRALAFSRTTPPMLYAAVGHGGDIFASTDGAQSWTHLGNYELTGFDAQLAVASGDGNVLFIAEDVRGAYRSLDGGHTWLPVSQGLPQDESGTAPAQSVAIDPTNANVVYLGTGAGPFNGNGVYKSTDGGETWAASNRGMIDYSIGALAVNPANPQIVYAGGVHGELFKSADGGATWNDLTANLPDRTSIVKEIVINPDVPESIYLLGGQGVLVSYDGGAKWHLLGKPGRVENPEFTAMVIIFTPQPVLVVGIGNNGGWRYAAD